MADDKDDDNPRKGIPTKSEVRQHPGNSDSEFAKREEARKPAAGDKPASERPQKEG